MADFPHNSIAAVLRLLLMTAFCDHRKGSISKKKMDIIKSIATSVGLDAQDFLRQLAIDYVRDRQSKPDTTEFLGGDEALPKWLVEKALGEITDFPIRLNTAQMMHAVATADDDPNMQDIILVQTAVGYWGLNKQWAYYIRGQAIPEDLRS